MNESFYLNSSVWGEDLEFRYSDDGDGDGGDGDIKSPSYIPLLRH